jgi:hypothetical protein
MRYLTYCLLLVVLAVVSVVLISCKEQDGMEPLLLLEDSNGDKNPVIDTGPIADNSQCYVCHINYQEDKLTTIHAKADIGCERCHGSSNDHRSDKDNFTPPDIMYPAEKINSFCKGCHPTAQLGGGKKYCTDCHGEHRLSHRTRKWDKTSGKLVEDGNVRMPTDNILEQ